ncbi:MAG TPA: nitroreductase family protein [Desulfomonilia bacterium]|nr:nitroreductase family protein [Desulfomonilia bacterium]
MISYEKSVSDLIRTRRSWRSYREEPVGRDDKDKIRAFIAGMEKPPFGSQVRFVLADAAQSFGRVRGTYGVITGASCFLVGMLKPSHKGFEDYGYLFEAAVLHITSLGLGTCWMGGTFNRTFFAETAKPWDGEIIPSISPVGMIAEKRDIVDSLFVVVAGSRTRKPWTSLFFKDAFDNRLDEHSAGPFALPLEMVRLAPSASNRQPWRIVMNDKGFHFYVTRTFGYRAMFGDVDLQRVDMGIAMFHFERTALELGLNGSWGMQDPAISPLPSSTEYVVSWIL